jgi:hypothetical protein
MPYSDKHKLIFIHIPKNAGTAITTSLEMNDVGHHKWEYYKNKYPEKWATYTKIAVLRNPWDRVVSNYEYARMEESHWHSTTGKARYSKHPDLDLLKDKSSITVVMQDGDTYNHGGETHYVYTSKKVRLISTSTGRSYDWNGWKALGDIPTPEENQFQISTDGTVEVTFKKQ